MMAPPTSKRSMAPNKKKLKDMNIDEFMTTDFGKDSETSSKHSKECNGKVKVKSFSKEKGEHKNKAKNKLANHDPKLTNKAKGNKNKEKKQKGSLAETLKDTDPDFYEYLQGEDGNLLKNLEDLSGSDSDKEYEDDTPKSKKKKLNSKFEKELLNMSSGDDSDSDDDGENLHTPSGELKVAASDEDSEDDSKLDSHAPGGTITVTEKMIEAWSERLQSSPSASVLKEVVLAFNGAVSEAEGNSKSNEETQALKYRIKGDTIFNGVVRLCLAYIPPALQTILDVPSLSSWKKPFSSKNNKWLKIRNSMKMYLSDVLQLLSQLSESAMINTLLKHVHKLTILYVSLTKKSKLLLKQMVKTWSTGEETSRVIAFLIINKMIQLQKYLCLEPAIKRMYMAYVSNCKFVSPLTLPLINFMQRSLVEIFNNDETVSYQYAFIYIRQLAIHLRNAMTITKKSTCDAVYNWQYIHCLGLWVQLLGSFPTEALKPLIYPLTQTIIGTMKLLPTARFYPLRFHCVKLLNTLSSKTKTYIPTLPFLLEVFEQTDFNKRPKSVSLKPFNFAVILKFTKPQLLEKAYKDGLIDQLYELFMESYNIHAHSVGFPELVIPSLLRLRDFNKKCKIANYCKQIKQIIEKVEEQSKFMTERRKRSALQLDNFQGLKRWEEEIENSPLRTYYSSWRKLRDRELMFEIAQKDAVSGAAIEIPVVRKKIQRKATAEEREDLAKLFEDISESDDETRFLLKEERPKTENRKRKRGGDSDSDEYSDLNEDELELLNRSASENEESESGDDENEIEDDESEIEDYESDMEEAASSDSEPDKEISTKKDKSPNKSIKKQIDHIVKSKVSNKKSSSGEEDDAEDVVEDFVLSDSDGE